MSMRESTSEGKSMLVWKNCQFNTLHKGNKYSLSIRVNPGDSNIYKDLNSSFVSNASKEYEVYFYESQLKIQEFILFPNHFFLKSDLNC